MEINKSSWHYRAFAWSYEWNLVSAPKVSDLCSYVRRLAFGVPFNAFIFGFLFSIIGAFVVVGNILMLPFGYYLRHPLFNNGADSVGEYSGLRIGKFELLPWHVIVPTLLVLLGWWNYLMFHQHGLFNKLSVVEMIVIGPLLVAGTWLFLDRTSTGNLAREYVDAKTQGICPLITFKDDQ